MTSSETLPIWILAAATIPLVSSILSAFSPRTRVRDIEGYFLYDRELDIDSFLKSTIGYSLQVASISIIFFWTLTYGVTLPALVSACWTAGYFLIAQALKEDKFDSFLGTKRSGSEISAETIHGYIGDRISSSSFVYRNFAILILSFASVIGLGGAMMTEIDYSTQYFLSSISASEQSTLRKIVIEGCILGFTTLYVLWGGYKSSIYTDRFQVPVAYVAFAIFGFGLAALTKDATEGGISIVVLLMAFAYSLMLYKRWSLLAKVMRGDSWDRLTTVLTFSPIVVAACGLLVYLGFDNVTWSYQSLSPILFPPDKRLTGVGLWGILAILFTNSLWQIIDISSLQRLQSIDKNEVGRHKSNIVRTLRWTGFEAGLGWLLIMLTAVILKISGFTADGFVSALSKDGILVILLPVFVFTVSVYMLSTISGFVSALSYISYYDVIPAMAGRVPSAISLPYRLLAARLTTVLVIVAIFALYMITRAITPNEKISSILFGIYAFQITLLPSVLVSIFAKRAKVYPTAVVASVILGSAVAVWSALHPEAWRDFQAVGFDEDSWTVTPPLLSGVVSCLAYATIASLSFGASKFFTRKQSK